MGYYVCSFALLTKYKVVDVERAGFSAPRTRSCLLPFTVSKEIRQRLPQTREGLPGSFIVVTTANMFLLCFLGSNARKNKLITAPGAQTNLMLVLCSNQLKRYYHRQLASGSSRNGWTAAHVA